MSNSTLLPKESLSAYQRWELAALDGVPGAHARSVDLPTAREIEALHQNAHREGFESGHREGRARVDAEVERLRAVISAFQGENEECERRVAESVVALALDLARHVVREALRVDAGLVIAVVRDAIRQMPLFSQQARVILHPDDAALVRERLAESLAQGGWSIYEDPALRRGDCRLETATSELDATLATRWQRIAVALGQSAAPTGTARAAANRPQELVA